MYDLITPAIVLPHYIRDCINKGVVDILFIINCARISHVWVRDRLIIQKS